MFGQDRLRELLRYDPKTGLFSWRVQSNGRVPAGTRAGTPKRRGNLEIKIDGKLYQASRLAFFYMTGQWPAADIDHINGNPTDNRWANLREATRGQNAANARRWRNKALPKGVYCKKDSSRYYARITVEDTTMHLGSFATADEAADAYFDAAKRFFGDFARAR
jgi:hypothetical protein